MRSHTAALTALTLLLAPSAASAQLTHTPEADRTFAGCNIYVCATITYAYGGSIPPYKRYQVTAALRLLSPLFTEGFQTTGSPVLGGALYGNNDLDDFTFNGGQPISLVGRAPGDVVMLNGQFPLDIRAQYLVNLDAPITLNFWARNNRSDELRVGLALTETPEPAPIVLTLAGLGVVAGMARQRQRASDRSPEVQ